MTLYCGDARYKLNIHQLQKNLPTLFLMHGFMGSSEGFANLSDLLKPVCNPVTIDLAGHGRSVAPARPGRFEAAEQVKDLKSILSRLQFNNLWLYGYSMGGRLAQNIFFDSPDQFSGLILESTHCGIKDQEERQKRRETDEQRASEIENDFNAFIEKWIELPLFESPEGARGFDYRPIMEKQDPKMIAATLRGFGTGSAPYLCDQLQTTQKPVGLISGKSDEKYVDKMREMHHLFPESELHVAPGAGHRVHADQPAQIVTFLTKFFDRYG